VARKNSQAVCMQLFLIFEFEIFEPDATKTQSLYSLIKGVVIDCFQGYDESIKT
jgi:DNA phosphorothioation-dependent restriction protein DptH